MTSLHSRLKTLLFLVPYAYRNQGVPLSELAQRLSLDEKQLFKELDFLMLVGRPPFSPDDLIDIHVDGGRVFVHLPSSLRHPARFTVYEVLALASAAQLFTGPETMGAAAKAVQVALEKVLASLPEESRHLFDELVDRYLILDGRHSIPHLDTIRQAVNEHIELVLKYYAAGSGEISDRLVRPYGIHHRRGVWYLIAYCTDRQAVRVFRMSRIRSAQLTERIFDPVQDFDSSAYLDERLTVPKSGESEVVIRMSPEHVRWVKERWSSEYLTEQTDGSLLVHFHDVSDEFVLAYVASFGGNAVIEKPLSLAYRLRQEALDSLKKYAGRDAAGRD